MSAPDPFDDAELDRYQAGMRHGVRLMLEGRPMEDIALELVLLRATVSVLTNELADARRTIRAYRTIIRG